MRFWGRGDGALGWAARKGELEDGTQMGLGLVKREGPACRCERVGGGRAVR